MLPTRDKLQGYGFAVLLMVAITGLKIAFSSLSEHPFRLFLAAVMIASWYGGLGPGLLATALATAIARGIFLPHLVPPVHEPDMTVALFAIEGALIAGLGAYLQRARQRAEDAEALLRQDLLERERIEDALRHSQRRLRESSRRKDEFLGMLSHELRNPLAALANAVALVRRNVRTDEALGMAERQVQRLGHIVNDLLDVSRITRGKVALDCERLVLGTVIDSAVQAARPQAAARGLTLNVSLSPEPLTLVGDRVRLEQVLGNLLDNAVKYTDPGGTIDVHAAREGEDLALHVRDTGMGISPDELPYLFDVFVQGERAPDRAGGGLGIGLSVVRGLVDLHGGRVEAKSLGKGLGAEFTVHLPALPAGVALPDEDVSPVRTPRSQGRLLIVEDNPDVLRSFTLLLAGFGYDVEGCGSGPAALDTIARSAPDVVLLDIGLPGMDGYEVARQVREQSGARQPLLVAMSGYSRDEDRERSQQAGFDLFVRKPIDPAALHALLADLTTNATTPNVHARPID